MRISMKVLFLIVLSFSVSCRDRDKSWSADKQMPRIESDIGLTFPEASVLDHFYEADRIVDPVWVAKVTIPAASYDGFKNTVAAKPTDNTSYEGGLANWTEWWKPENVVLTKQYLANSHTLVQIVISQEEKGYAVYIECAVF